VGERHHASIEIDDLIESLRMGLLKAGGPSGLTPLTGGVSSDISLVGSFARSERMAKCNEAQRIEEALGSQARFVGLDETPMRRRAPNPVDRASGAHG
jgi:hypothetical protein